MDIINKIFAYWFGYIDAHTAIDKKNNIVRRWFGKNPDFDRDIYERFEVDLKNADKGLYDDWKRTAKGALALIILLDQFPRNMYRGRPQSFAYDKKALDICFESIEKGYDKELILIYRVFLYMPMMHSEDIKVQEQSLKYFQSIVDEAKNKNDASLAYYEYTYGFAKRHYEIIEMFGRFPHRNAVLSRENTPEEKGFLKLTGSGF